MQFSSEKNEVMKIIEKRYIIIEIFRILGLLEQNIELKEYDKKLNTEYKEAYTFC